MEKLVIRVQGGMVQEVYSDTEDVELTIIDEDSDIESADEVWESIDIPKYQIYWKKEGKDNEYKGNGII